MSKLNATPTGCPGPIPGTRIWRCDGTNCVYGPSHYVSCKQAIADRGYTLRLSSDLIEEAAEAAELIRQNVQSELADEKADKERIVKQAESMDEDYRARLATEMFKTDAQKNIADEFANLYYSYLLREQSLKDNLWTATQTAQRYSDEYDAQCEHCAALLKRIAELEDELLYYKQLEAKDVEENTSVGTDTTDMCDNDSCMPDNGLMGGEER